jgi:hypothetical protein
MLSCHVSNEFGAGTIGWVMELFATGVGSEVGFVFFIEKCALMVIEPPGQARIAGVFEIDDGIFIAVK